MESIDPISTQMKSPDIKLESVKKALLMPASKPLVLYLTASPLLLFFVAHPKNTKIFISLWIIGHLIMIPSILLGWFLGRRLTHRKAQKITNEINLAFKKGEIIRKIKVLPGKFIFKSGLSTKRDALELTNNHKVSVVCFHKPDESFEAILWKISPQNIYIAVPLEKMAS